MMQKKKAVDATIMTLGVLGSLICVNIVGCDVFARLDLTRDKQFTLSEATETTLVTLEDPVTIKAYFTKDMPQQFASLSRYVQDLLEEYYAASDGMLRYEFIDPQAEETDEDKAKKKEVKRDIFGRTFRERTSIEVELEELGIPPVQVRVNEDDKLEVKRAYMGLAIKQGDASEVIPVVQDMGNLEYDLTTLIRKMTRNKTPKVAFVTGAGSISPKETLSKLFQLLGQTYEVSVIDMSTETSIGDDVDAIIVLSAQTPYSEPAQKAIDTFVMSGRSAAFLLDLAKVDLPTLSAEDTNHGLLKLLTAYGAVIENSLILDTECATINISQQRSFMRIMQPVRYPYVPIAKALKADHPLTRGLAQVAFPFMSPVVLADDMPEGVTGEILVQASANSWTAETPFNLDPLQQWTKEAVGDQKAETMLISLSGALKSHFGEGQASEPGVSVAANARVLVGGGASFMKDQFLSPTNSALVLNLMDWLLQDEALLSVRSRGLTAAPLDEISGGSRALMKYGNIIGLPIAFIIFGLMRWRRREAQRSKVTL